MTPEAQRIEPVVPLGKFLRRLRASHDMTLRRLSDLSGVSMGALSMIESGRQENPMLVTVQRIALCGFGMLPSEFLRRWEEAA